MAPRFYLNLIVIRDSNVHSHVSTVTFCVAESLVVGPDQSLELRLIGLIPGDTRRAQRGTVKCLVHILVGVLQLP